MQSGYGIIKLGKQQLRLETNSGTGLCVEGGLEKIFQGSDRADNDYAGKGIKKIES